ncbi:pro-epidermal growth factor-like, partial [Dendronephthya gigantea]|uniref:pro-epidermal growth factor-like n=1 Tax=Dendronephthya gigantea TaxID=151771 RepID=UPI00106A95B5
MGNQWFLYFLLFTLGNPEEGTEYIFYSNITHISYISTDGGDSVAFASSGSATLDYDELNYRIWYTEDVNLYNAKLDGSDLRRLLKALASDKLFAVDAANQTVYYLNGEKIKSIDYNGSSLPDIGLEDAVYQDLKIDTYNRSIFLTTDTTNNRNLIRYSLADGTIHILHFGVNEIGTHLALDTVNKTVYWILFTTDSNYKILKTTYDGLTSQIGTDQSGGITTVDIADGNGYYYILDTITSQIDKYDKSTNTVAATISLSTEATRMIVVSDKDYCFLNNTCPANSTCTNSPGTIVCSCDEGFTGNKTICEDVDECAKTACGLNSNCTNTIGSYLCECQAGFNGNGRNCTDINECQSSPCDMNANCSNSDGSFTCTCNEGFEGNGTSCTDVNECKRDAPCHANATCANVKRSYYCTCKTNYTGDGFFCEALVCTVDALYYATTSAIKGVFSDGNSTATILSATNAKLNYDSGTKRLIYYDGSKLITVKPDGSDPMTIRGSLTTLDRFTVDYIKRKVYFIGNLFRKVGIVDVDTGNLSDLNPFDIVNAYDLDSDPTNNTLVFADIENGDIVRYYLDKDTQEIIYHNNTSPKYLSVDSQYEVIYWIDYISASSSFSLMKTYFNGSTSQIKLYSGVTSSVNVAIGEDYFYTMDSTRQSIDRFDRPTATFQGSFDLSDKPQEITVVQDLDECCEGGYCHDNATCTNTPGSYFCTCKLGFTGNNTYCQDINECEPDAPCHANATCTNVEGSYYCACKTNYSGDGFFCEALVCTVDAIYYATTSAIKGVFSDGNSTKTILSATNVKLNYDSGTKRLIYYDGSKLITVKLDGSDPITIRGSLTNLDRFTVDYIKRKVYFITSLFKKMSIVDLDTGNLTDLNPTDIVKADDLDSDPTNSSLVFADIVNGDIVRYYLDKDTQEIIYHNNTSPKYLAVDSQYEVIYWIDYISASSSFSLMKTYFNGSTSQIKLYSGVTSSVNVAIGEDYFYTMDSTRQSIDRFDRPTATFQDLFDLSDKPQEITVVQDLDECCVSGYCHDNATCTNTPGSYFCTCKLGFTGNNTYCQDVDECQTSSPCHSNATCNNTDGSYICTCDSGY